MKGRGASRLWILALCLFLLVPGCKKGKVTREDGKPLVVATTTMIAEMARRIGGDAIKVVSIMRVAEDPHTHQPTSRDAIYFQRGKLILVNGLHLEGKMLDMITNVGNKAVKLAEQTGIKTRKSGAVADPHVWWDASFFALMAQKARDAMLPLFVKKPAIQKAIRARTATYVQELLQLHRAIKTLLASIPVEQRYMITSHDAFFYFGAAYGIKVDAVGGISTEARVRAVEALRLAKLVSEKKIRAIFSESSVSQSLNDILSSVRRLAREKYKYTVLVKGPLFSDSLGEPTSKAGTYIGALKANAAIVYESLTGKKIPASFAAIGQKKAAKQPAARSANTRKAAKSAPTPRKVPAARKAPTAKKAAKVKQP